MDFTKIYESEIFYRDDDFEWIDCTHIRGTNCYCDEDAEAELKGIIKDYLPYGVHFIDSGNYHYMSKLWTDKIHEPFVLAVFDHHPDMQPSLFGSLMSCGCWVKKVLDTNPYVKKAVLIGADDSLLQNIESKYRDRIVCFSENNLHDADTWKKFADIHINASVYISVDKDVLNTESAVTSWDQGSLTLPELKSLFSMILKKQRIIGIDICGECADTPQTSTGRYGMMLNDTANDELLHLIETKKNDEFF